MTTPSGASAEPTKPHRVWSFMVNQRPGATTFAMAFLFFAATASWLKPSSIDVEAAILASYQIATDGTPWLDQFRGLNDNPWLVEANGHLVSNRQIGIILLGVPFYWVFGSPLAVWPSALAAVTVSAAAVSAMHLAVRQLVSSRSAWAVTFVMLVATPTWTVSADGLWSHTLTQAAIAFAAWAASRNRWWLTGLALGVGILARPHLAVIALCLGLWVGLTRRSVRITVAVGVPSLAGAGLLLILNHWVFGIWSLTGYSSYGSDAIDNLAVLGQGAGLTYVVNWLGLLVSADRGLFVWTPIALVLLPGVWRVRHIAPDWVLALLLGGLGYSAVQMQVNAFHGGDAFFGYRHALELLTCALPIYAIAWDHSRGWIRRVVAFLFVLQTFAMAIGALYPSGWLSTERVWTLNSLVALATQFPVPMVAMTSIVVLIAVRVAAETSLETTGSSETADCTADPGR